jgi:hypothetical protein
MPGKLEAIQVGLHSVPGRINSRNARIPLPQVLGLPRSGYLRDADAIHR